MKTQTQNLSNIKKKYRRNNVLAIYMLSITSVVITYAMYMAQIHL
jgi:hypothetical protein